MSNSCLFQLLTCFSPVQVLGMFSLIQFGSSNFHQEFDLWFYWIVGQLTLSVLSFEIRRSNFDEIDRHSAPMQRFEICCWFRDVVG